MIKPDNAQISETNLSPIGTIIPTPQFVDYSRKQFHAEILADMCNRVAICYGRSFDECVTAGQVLQLLNDANWQTRDGIHHSEDTPLTIEPIFPVTSRYFTNRISNYRVAYLPNTRPGEYRIRRTTPQWLLELETGSAEMAGVA